MKCDNTVATLPRNVETVSQQKFSAEISVPKFPPRKIKKLPVELRKPVMRYQTEPHLYRRFILKIKGDSQFLRSIIQITFLLLCIWIGIRFYLFVKWGASQGTEIFYNRPPGAEGFLPISALISLKYFIQTGIVNTIHPSGLFIFIAIMAIGLLFKKAFCSWLCPIGTLSESLWMLGKKFFGKNIVIPKWLDYPLRSLKYLLLLFFVYVIWQMDDLSLKMFIESPYNKVADIKMYYFFARIGSVALWTIATLIVSSVFIKNFWCRFLCPYGALLGIVGWFSPLKVTRNNSTCIDCELCTKVCPADIKVHAAKRVMSDECMNCLACVQICPVKNTLDLRVPVTKTRVPNLVFGLLLVGVFVAITGFAMLTGHWQNSIRRQEYLDHFRQLESPVYSHERAIR
jgi:polyferredoxin